LFWIPLMGLIAWKLNSLWPILFAAVIAAAGWVVWWMVQKRRSRDKPDVRET
jgi:hypothetical protein